MTSLDFRGRHVVVTGGAGALGSVVVDALLDAGAECHVPVREDAAARTLRGRQHIHVRPKIDLTVESSVTAWYESLPELWASLHLAGGFAMKPVAETSLDDFAKQFSLNAVTCFLCSREAVKTMRKHGKGGRIVNVAARPVLEPTSGMIAYATAKSAVAALARHLAEETKKEGILVNAVVPSIIDTPANRAAMPDAEHGRWPKPEQIARMVLFLASPENELTSGDLVSVRGEA